VVVDEHDVDRSAALSTGVALLHLSPDGQLHRRG
jgi:hypothetical protein